MSAVPVMSASGPVNTSVATGKPRLSGVAAQRLSISALLTAAQAHKGIGGTAGNCDLKVGVNQTG